MLSNFNSSRRFTYLMYTTLLSFCTHLAMSLLLRFWPFDKNAKAKFSVGRWNNWCRSNRGEVVLMALRPLSFTPSYTCLSHGLVTSGETLWTTPRLEYFRKQLTGHCAIYLPGAQVACIPSLRRAGYHVPILWSKSRIVAHGWPIRNPYILELMKGATTEQLIKV